MVALIILCILILPYLILTAVDRLGRGSRLQPGLRGRISLALVFLFTGLGHFIQPEAMAQMLPPWVPVRVAIIYSTGVLELAAAVGLLVPGLWRLTGVCLIVFLILALPANVYAAINHVEMGGHGIGPAYLLVRVPLQLILIGWTYWFAVRQSTIEAVRRGDACEE
ncbi:MAG: DoxX family protein [Candidatus Entotheonellia bacterium]